MGYEILTEDHRRLYEVDDFISLTWTIRYAECGDFEIEVPLRQRYIDTFVLDAVVYDNESDHHMIIEKVFLRTDQEKGNTLVARGRDLKSLLERRVIWPSWWMVDAEVQNIAHWIVDRNFTNPTDANRTMQITPVLSSDPLVKAKRASADYSGQNALEEIKKLAVSSSLGFYLVPTDNAGLYIYYSFGMYHGVNRSDTQSERPVVEFSPMYETLTSSEYLHTNENYKNFAYILGEEMTPTEEVPYRNRWNTSHSTLNSSQRRERRRELTINASDLQSKQDDDTVMSPTDYMAILRARGLEQLGELKEQKLLTGEIVAGGPYEYGVDYNLGDLVTIANEYGHRGVVRVEEYTTTIDANGIFSTPIFKTI